MNLRALFAFLVWAGIGYAAIIGLNRFYEESRIAVKPSAPKKQMSQKASPVDLPDRDLASE